MMNHLILTAIVFFAFAGATPAQLATSSDSGVSDSCFEIKYLDFFSLTEDDVPPLAEKQLDQLLAMNFSAAPGQRTNFLIPRLVYYLRDYHPNCRKKTVAVDQFERLVQLYCRIRHLDYEPFRRKEPAAQLELIREDFYRQTADENLLSRMIFSFGDRPLYGETLDEGSFDLEIEEQLATGFGHLALARSPGKTYLAASDKKKKIIWIRALTGQRPEKRYFTNVRFDKRRTRSIRKTSLAWIVPLVADGERLTLYLRPDGRFMFYSSTW